MCAILTIIAELRTPSNQAGPLTAGYNRAVVGIAHAVLGACVGALAGPVYALPVAVVMALVYWLAKERADLARGGSFWDGIEDAVMVSFGAWYGGAEWPFVVLGAAGYIMATAAWRAGK